MKHATLFVLGLLALLCASTASADPAPSAWESALLEQATTCAEVTPQTRTMLLRMLRLEADAGVPPHAAGITVAIACIESKYDPKAEGDHKFSKSGKSPMAVGLFQMWPWWAKFKFNRRKPFEATRAWLAFVNGRLPVVAKRCHPASDAQKWSAAIAYTMRGPGKRGGQMTSHHRLLRKWHQAVAKVIPVRIGQR